MLFHYSQRLLNQGPDYKCYYHECFLRGRPELTKMMQRLINPGKRLPDKAGEPDFYEISRQYPLPAGPAVSDTNPMLRTPAPFASGYQKPPAPTGTTPGGGSGAEGAGGPPAPGQMPGQAGAAGACFHDPGNQMHACSRQAVAIKGEHILIG